MKHLKGTRRHSKAFRKEAVELLLTGRTLAELSEELQVPVATLHNWKQEYLLDLEHKAPDVATLPPLKMQEEIQRLRKENQKQAASGNPKKSVGHTLRCAAERYALIESMALEYPILDLCVVLGVARSSYYAWRGAPQSPGAMENEVLRKKISRLFVANRQVYGSPRLCACLRQAGIACSRNRV